MESGGLSPLGAALALLGTTLILLLPRRTAMLPIFAAVCFLPIGQSLRVAGLNFFLFRLVLLAALVRALMRGELRAVNWCRLDTLVLCWAIAFIVLGTLSHGLVASVYLMGLLYNGLGSYIVARCLLRDRRDFLQNIRFLALILVPLVAAMSYEKATGRNVFAVLGGVDATSLVRDGKLRAQGAFQHPILAGTFGATVLPLMVGLLRMRDRSLRRVGVLGTACSTFVTFAAASSGAFLGALASIGAMLLWRIRRSLRLVLLGFVVLLVILQLGMSRPLWWIFDAIGDITGGEGWHRSFIIDAAIRHFGEWWLAGTPVTVHWGGYHAPMNDPNNIDITNHFLAEAVGGGVVRLGLFLAILWTCFRGLGRAFRAPRGSIQPDTEWLAWTTGVALLCHCVCFFSVAYYDQMIFNFFWLVAAIAAGTREKRWLVSDRSARSSSHPAAMRTAPKADSSWH